MEKPTNAQSGWKTIVESIEEAATYSVWIKTKAKPQIDSLIGELSLKQKNLKHRIHETNNQDKTKNSKKKEIQYFKCNSKILHKIHQK